MNLPVKCRRASRCRACGADMRKGDAIKPVPQGARWGEVRYWVHDECEVSE